MDSSNYLSDPLGEEQRWDMTATCRAMLRAELDRLEADGVMATALGEYRLARYFMWQRERIRLTLHPPSAATASRPYRPKRGPRQ
jgi:hypothetical protein